MRYLLPFLAATLLAAPASAQSEFRGHEWGTSESEIVAEEGEPKAELQKQGVPVIAYDIDVAGFSAAATYMLTPEERKLGGGAYIFREDHTNSMRYLSDYQEISKILIENYGEADDMSWEWSEDRYKDDRSKYGLALELGHFTIEEKWEGEEGVVFHMIRGGNYEVRHIVQYISKKHLDVIGGAASRSAKEAF